MVDVPQISLHWDLINLTSAAVRSTRKCLCIKFIKKIVICSHICCHFVLPFSLTMQVLRRRKRDLKKQKIRSSNDVWKGYLKTWDRWNSQSFQGRCLWTAQRRVYRTPYKPPVARFNMLIQVKLRCLAIKLSPSWKMEVSKSAWIKSCYL